MSALPLLSIPESQVAITRLGFGCARLYGGREQRMSRKLIEAALACGIRHFDTAPVYGNGTSEAALGDVLLGVPGATVASKIGLPRPRSNKEQTAQVLYRRLLRPALTTVPRLKAMFLRRLARNAAPAPSLRRRLDRDDVLRNLEDSLRHLRRTRIDIYLIHEPERFELTPELCDVFKQLQSDGTIGAFGLGWGGRTGDTRRFGTVVQSRYGQGATPSPAKSEVQIFHGVLRHGDEESGDRESAGAQIRQVFDRHANAAVIFSASAARQIRDVTDACGLKNWSRGGVVAPTL